VSLGAYGYYLVYPRQVATDSAIGTFRDWIMHTAELDNGRHVESSAAG